MVHNQRYRFPLEVIRKSIASYEIQFSIGFRIISRGNLQRYTICPEVGEIEVKFYMNIVGWTKRGARYLWRQKTLWLHNSFHRLALSSEHERQSLDSSLCALSNDHFTTFVGLILSILKINRTLTLSNYPNGPKGKQSQTAPLLDHLGNC